MSKIKKGVSWYRMLLLLMLLLMASAVSAAVLSVPFYSQKDSQWASQKLGTSNLTMGGYGCAVTSMAMELKFRGADVDPGKLNQWLTANGGYSSGNLVDWAKAAKFKGTTWLQFDGSGTLGSLSQINTQLANRKLIIAMSNRFPGSTHFVVIRGATPDGTAGYYWDPWDTSATQRRIGDGWVNTGNSTRVFSY